jgi:hypothetical protein
MYALQRRIQDFKLGGGGALKEIMPSGWRRENFWVYCVKNHDFTPKKPIFFPILGGAVAPPPWIRPCFTCNFYMYDSLIANHDE